MKRPSPSKKHQEKQKGHWDRACLGARASNARRRCRPSAPQSSWRMKSCVGSFGVSGSHAPGAHGRRSARDPLWHHQKADLLKALPRAYKAVIRALRDYAGDCFGGKPPLARFSDVPSRCSRTPTSAARIAAKGGGRRSFFGDPGLAHTFPDGLEPARDRWGRRSSPSRGRGRGRRRRPGRSRGRPSPRTGPRQVGQAAPVPQPAGNVDMGNFGWPRSPADTTRPPPPNCTKGLFA